MSQRRTDQMNAHQLLDWLLTCDSRDEIHFAISSWLRANPRSPEEQALALYYGYNANIVSPRLDELASIARCIVSESGSDQANDFDARRWIDGWAHSPLIALGGQLPVELLHTEEGVARVRQLLEQIQSGAYV